MMRPALPVLVVLAVATALAGAACRSGGLDDSRLERVEALPGFDLKLPGGKRERERRTPGAGEILLRTGGAVIAVTWQAGSTAEADLLGFGIASMEAMGVVTGGRTIDRLPLTLPAPDHAVELLSPTDKRVFLVLTLVQCAKANATVSLMTMASSDRERAIAFHRRLRSTLTCRQDAAPLDVGVALPAFQVGDDVAHLPASDPPSYYGLGGERWHVTPGTATERRAFDNPEVVKRMFSTLGLPILGQEAVPHAGPADWKISRLLVDVDGQHGQVLVGSLVCGADRGYTVVHLNLSRLDTPPGLASLERVSCPRSPVDADSLPTVQARFGAACDGGDGQACALLAWLVEEEPALLAGQDATALFARACQLGITTACR